MNQLADPALIAANVREIKARAGAAPITHALVLGTGLGEAFRQLPHSISIDYADLPGFPASSKSGATISGHAGRLIIADHAGLRLAIMLGRAHVYQTGNPRCMAVPLASFAELGAKELLLTNAAGSVTTDLPPPAVVLIKDHINLNGPNPLIGLGTDQAFVPMTQAYDETIATRLQQSATALNMNVAQGIYMWFSGPSFETPAEIRMAKNLGADLIGMSTVPEVIMGRYLGLAIGALSVVTNFGAGFAGGAPHHGETKEKAAQGAADLFKLLMHYLASSAPSPSSSDGR